MSLSVSPILPRFPPLLLPPSSLSYLPPLLCLQNLTKSKVLLSKLAPNHKLGKNKTSPLHTRVTMRYHSSLKNNSANLRLTHSPSAVFKMLGVRARGKAKAEESAELEWEQASGRCVCIPMRPDSPGAARFKNPVRKTKLKETLSLAFSFSSLPRFLPPPVLYYQPSSNNPSVLTMSRDGGAVIAWKEHNYKVKLVRNGKQHFPHIQECSTRDTFTLLSTTIHKEGIWKRNPTLLGQVCNDLSNAAISTYFTSVINYCAKGWESGEPYFILQAQQVLLI